MTETSKQPVVSLLRSVSARQVRLICGIVLFTYLVSHFLNHALGNISLSAMDAGANWHMQFWQFPPMAVTFYGAAAIHAGLGIWALYERRQFHRRSIEPLQILLGLSIPLLVVGHVVGMRLSHVMFAQERGYEQVFYGYWVLAPYRMWLMYTLILIAWVHGCIGLYFWLRIKSLYKRASPYLLSAAVLVPTLALLGLYQGGRIVAQQSDSPQWQQQNLAPKQIGTPEQNAVLQDLIDNFMLGYISLIGLALVARGGRLLVERRTGTINLIYGDGRTVRIPRGLSVLEASLRHRVPHASVCGGRARCSTCRIRVTSDLSTLPEPSAREAFVLGRIGAGHDPAIRLACQLRPATDLAFMQLFAPQMTSANAHASHPARIGQERYLVCMFIDMRGSTMLAEKRLPFDTVFIVNRFLAAVSQAVVACGGQPNQFIGDGELALFGLTCDPQTACRQALQAAQLIGKNIDELNRTLAHDLSSLLRFGIGIHGGEVIVGDIGYRDHMVFTALGDAVNVAARLQDMTKSLAAEVIVSDDVFTTGGIIPETLSPQDVAIRGRNAPMTVYAVVDTKVLAELVATGACVATV